MTKREVVRTALLVAFIAICIFMGTLGLNLFELSGTKNVVTQYTSGLTSSTMESWGFFAAIVYGVLGHLIAKAIARCLNRGKQGSATTIDYQQISHVKDNSMHAEQQVNLSYKQRGRAMRIWATVNACVLFITVLPFGALYFALKAQLATDELSFQKYHRKSKLFNIAPYVLLFIASVVVNSIIPLLQQ